MCLCVIVCAHVCTYVYVCGYVCVLLEFFLAMEHGLRCCSTDGGPEGLLVQSYSQWTFALGTLVSTETRVTWTFLLHFYQGN